MSLSFSIITLTNNSQRYLADTMRSVLTQLPESSEYLIIDNCSTDKTLEIARSFHDPRVKIVSEPDNGIADAMNKGIRLSQGEVIGILHSDDVYEEFCLKKVHDFFQNSSDRWCYGRLVFEDPVSGLALGEMGEVFDIEKMKKRMCIPHPTVFCRRELYSERGDFDSRYKLSMDYELCLRFALQEAPGFIPSRLVRMKRGGVSNCSLRNRFRALWESKRIKNQYFPGRELIHFLHFSYFCARELKGHFFHY